jgi:hypothetical protein
LPAAITAAGRFVREEEPLLFEAPRLAIAG